jgi:hypothetical protein
MDGRHKMWVMEVSVTTENLKSVLTEIKRQFISIAIRNRTGKWSDQYFDIDDVKEFKSNNGQVTALILHSQNDSLCIVMDIRSILGLKLSKYLTFNGDIAREVTVCRGQKSDG